MTVDRTSQCAWPSLLEPYATALREATELIFQEVDPVGIVATGTIIRGGAHANSDLDLFVIHLASHRRRIQRFFKGVPAEIFINPPSAVRSYFGEEDRDGRRLTAHMLATGTVIFSTDPVVDELRAEAARWLSKDTPISEFERVSTRYTIASRLEDAIDVLGTDDVTAAMLLSDAVVAMLEFACKAESGRIPRPRFSCALAATQPKIAALAGEFFRAVDVSERTRLAMAIADSTIGARGFFPGIPDRGRRRAKQSATAETSGKRLNVRAEPLRERSLRELGGGAFDRLTMSGSSASRSFPFKPRKTYAAMNATRLLPST